MRRFTTTALIAVVMALFAAVAYAANPVVGPARSYADALKEIRSHSGTQFDPAVVQVLERLDPAEVEPLLEPAQPATPMAGEPLAELPGPGPLVAA